MLALQLSRHPQGAIHLHAAQQLVQPVQPRAAGQGQARVQHPQPRAPIPKRGTTPKFKQGQQGGVRNWLRQPTKKLLEGNHRSRILGQACLDCPEEGPCSA
jgi:hypothetical protein